MMRISVVTFAALAAASPIMQLRDGQNDPTPAYSSVECTSTQAYSSKPSSIYEGDNGGNGGSNTTPSAAPSSTEVKGDGSGPALPTGSTGLPLGLPMTTSISTPDLPKLPLGSDPHQDLPAMELPIPDSPVEVPSTDPKLPDIGLNLPDLGLTLPSIGAPLPSLEGEIGMPSINIPDLQLPDLGAPLDVPDVKLPIGDVSAGLNPIINVDAGLDLAPGLGMDVDGALKGNLPSLGNNGGADGHLKGDLDVGLGSVIGKGGLALPGLGMNVGGSISVGLPALNAGGVTGGVNVDTTKVPSSFLNADGSIKIGQGSAGFPGLLIDVKGDMHMGSNNGPLVVIVDGAMKLGGSNGIPLALGGKGELHLGSENGPLLSVLASGKMQLGSGGPFLALGIDASMHLGSLQGPLLSVNGQGKMQLNNGGLNNGPLLEILASGEMHLGSLHGPILKVHGDGLMEIDTGKGFMPFFLSLSGVMHLHDKNGPIFSIEADGSMYVGDDGSSSGFSAEAEVSIN